MLSKIKHSINAVLSRGWAFLQPRKKLGFISFAIIVSLVIVIWFAATPFAHADGLLEGAGEWLISLISRVLFALAGFFIGLTFFALRFLIEIAGYNGFIDSPAVTVGWVMIRDITNMIFVIVLLVISFGTILGLEQYEYKKLLVKLLMAAIVVNFSRIICGLIIDVGQVVMITFVNGIAATASGNLVNMFHVDKIFQLSSGNSARVGTYSEIFIASVAAVTFSVIMLVTMLTFLFVLLARMVVLWILIVLSPFAFVLNVLPQTEKYASEWWGQFGGHVLAGPVVVFFLWLSFVTVGSGNIHDEIKNNNSLPENQRLQAGAPEEERTGITEIMSWEEMANFFVAVAMAILAAHAAQRLHATGAGSMAKAGELGKKVAMYASGLQAARWTGAKAVSAGKWTAMKMPFGGDFWKRQGQGIAAQFKYRWGQVNERRNEGAVSLEKNRNRLRALEKKKKAGTLTDKEEKEYKQLTGVGGKAGRAGSWLLARVLEPTGRAEKRVKDWEKAAENQEAIVDESYSTSKEPGGIAKTNSGRRRHTIEELAESKRHIKEATEESRLRSRAAMTHLQHKIHKAEEDGDEEKKAKLEEKLEEAMRNHKEKFSENFTKPNFDDENYVARMEKAEEAHAQSEVISKEISHEKEIDLARNKDKELERRGESPRYESSARAAHQKELEDQWNTLTYRELTEQAPIIAKQMSEALFGSPAYKRLAANAAAIMSAATKKGREYGMAAIDNASAKVGFNEEVRAGDMEATQRKILSALLGRNVQKEETDKDGNKVDGLAKAVKDFTHLHGDQTGVILRNVHESLKKTAADGGVNVAGILNDAEVDEKGRVKFRFNGFDEKGNRRTKPEQQEADEGYFKGQRQYYAGEVVIPKLDSLIDILTKSADNSSLATPIDQQGMQQFISTFGSMTRATRLHNRLLEQFSGMLNDQGKFKSEEMRSNFQNLFRTFLKANREAAKATLGKLGQFTEALKEGNEELVQAVKEIKGERSGGRPEDREGESDEPKQ